VTASCSPSRNTTRPNGFGSPSYAAAQPVAGYRRLHPEQSTDAFVLHHPEANCVHTAALTESGAVAAGLEAAVNAA
jgi:hypothetical protein